MQGRDKGEYSFSTCWNIRRHPVGEDMIREIAELGFRRVELNYNVTKEMLTTIEPMIERGRLGYPVYTIPSLIIPTLIMVRIPSCLALKMKLSASGRSICWLDRLNMLIVMAEKLLSYIRARYLFRMISARIWRSCTGRKARILSNIAASGRSSWNGEKP